MKFNYTEYLFSYGTLRYEKVQLATFGRKLTGQPDLLPGYFLEKLKISDPEVVKAFTSLFNFLEILKIKFQELYLKFPQRSYFKRINMK